MKNKTAFFVIFFVALGVIVLGFVPQTSSAEEVIQEPVTSGVFCYKFLHNIDFKHQPSTEDAVALYQVLVHANVWDSRVPIVTYDEYVSVAVAAFQNIHAGEVLWPNGIFHGTGRVDKLVRDKINRQYKCPKERQNFTTLSASTSTLSVVATSTKKATSTATTTKARIPLMSLTLSGTSTIESVTPNQAAKASSLLAKFPLRLAYRNWRRIQPSYTDFTVVFRDQAGRSYIAPIVGVNTVQDYTLKGGAAADVTVTAQVPVEFLFTDGVYDASITSFRFLQGGRPTTQTYNFEEFVTKSPVNLVK